VLLIVALLWRNEYMKQKALTRGRTDHCSTKNSTNNENDVTKKPEKGHFSSRERDL